jgi:hypothetical protein
MAELMNELNSPPPAGEPSDIQMDGRETFELERRFGELSPEDTAYLRSKGITSRRIPETLLTGT